MKRILLLTAITFLILSCTVNDDWMGTTEIAKWQDGKRAAISITYDDASINQFRQALPIMDTLGFRGTFFINTADIPGSEFPPKHIGRPIYEIVKETGQTPTTQANLFERASALRFLDIPGAISSHNSAGTLYENEKVDEACKVVDDAFAEARRKKAGLRKTIELLDEHITWPELEEFAGRGHEIANHTISHPRLAVLDEVNLLYELEKCKEEIRNKLGTEHTFSAECPFGTENEREMEYAYKVHPALRNRMPEPFLEEINRWSKMNPGESNKEYVQFQRGPLQKTPMELMKSWVDTLLMHDNVWLVLTFHGVDGVGWEAKPHEELKEYFTYMKEKEHNLWVTPFRDATRYMRERMHGKVLVKEKGDNIILSLTHTLDRDLYNLPLTLKTYVPEEWGSVEVVQGKNNQTVQSSSDDAGAYVQYQARPNGEDIVLTNKKSR